MATWLDGEPVEFLRRVFPEEDEFGRDELRVNISAGFARVYFQDETIERGPMVNGSFQQGDDYIPFPQGTKYLGRLNPNIPEDNRGMWIFHENSFYESFNGLVVDGQMRNGELKMKDGTKYVGEFYDKNFSGKGTRSFQFNDTEIVEEGVHENGFLKYGKRTTKTGTELSSIFPVGSVFTQVGEFDGTQLTNGTLTTLFDSPENNTLDTNGTGVHSVAEMREYLDEFFLAAESNLSTIDEVFTHFEFTVLTPDYNQSRGRATWLTGEQVVSRLDEETEELFFTAPNGFTLKNVTTPNGGFRFNITFADVDPQGRLKLEAQSDSEDTLGTLTWKNGDQYDGQIEDDEPNGNGSYTFSDGRRFVGQWLTV